MLEKLLHLQRTIHQCFLNWSDSHDGWIDWYTESDRNLTPRLCFVQRGDFFDIMFFGQCEEDYKTRPSSELFEEGSSTYPFVAFLELLARQEIADKIISLRFESPDEGADGLKDYAFQRLVDSGVTFPNVRHFSVGLTKQTDHNTGIIIDGNKYEENGIIARLVSVMPELRSLTIPSVPNKSFFEIGPLKLTELIVQAEFDRQNFIENLADSNNLPDLRFLDYSDYRLVLPHMAGTETPFESYKKLFQSPLFQQSHFRSFWLRNSIMTRPQLSALVTISKYVRGKDKQEILFRHISSYDEFVEESTFCNDWLVKKLCEENLS